MIYNKIINPKTNRKVNIKSKIGKQILNNYIKFFNKNSKNNLHGGAFKQSDVKDTIKLIYSHGNIPSYKESVTLNSGDVDADKEQDFEEAYAEVTRDYNVDWDNLNEQETEKMEGILADKLLKLKTYNKIEDVFFKIPSNITIYISTPGIDTLARIGTCAESDIKILLKEMGIYFFIEDPAKYSGGLGEWLQYLGLHESGTEFPDFSLSFGRDRDYFNMWSQDINSKDRKLEPYRKWSPDLHYSFKHIVNSLPKEKHHHVILHCCNPLLLDWTPRQTRIIMNKWVQIMNKGKQTMTHYRKVHQRPITRKYAQDRHVSPHDLSKVIGNSEGVRNVWTRGPPIERQEAYKTFIAPSTGVDERGQRRERRDHAKSWMELLPSNELKY